jgi:drug/metabolite transporter (DMT)-like permease
MKIIVWLLLCLIWGTTWFFIKIGLQDLPPISFAAARFILALLILGAVIRFKKIPVPNDARTWKLLALTGFLQFSVNYSMVFWSEQYISSGLAAVLQATIPIFGLILAGIFLPAERITWIKARAVLLGFAGVVIIFLDQMQIKGLMGLAGCAAIIVGAYAASQSVILTKKYGGGLNPISLVFGQMSCGVVPLILYGLVKEGNPLEFNWTVQAWLCIFYLAIFGTVITFYIFYWLLSRIESTKVMMNALLTPLIAVIVGSIFLGEKLPLQTISGGILILASIGLIVFRKTASPAEAESVRIAAVQPLETEI